MKKISFWSFSLVILMLFSCEKSFELEEVAFNIKEVKISDAEDEEGNPVKKVVFDFEGSSDVLSFYSGELFHNYDNRTGRIVRNLALQMSFSSNCKLNSGTRALEDQLSVQISHDFNGVYTVDNINAATWIDVTDKFVLSPLVPGDDFITSGEVNLKDLSEPGKPMYISFKYVTPRQTSQLRHTQWRIRNFQLTQNTDIGTSVLATQSTFGWNMLHEGVLENGRSSSSSSQIVLRGNNRSANFDSPTVDWAVSPPITFADDVDLGPDLPVAIKSYGDNPVQSFTYYYSQPGTYKAVFKAANQNIKDQRELIKEIVVPAY
ncbi:DUF5017 domain-containing protein [Desertivirga xinjiangensis]|uniref:DUF5017 domain-containing protein n=1 Tax=Desertivirga xinjiangensis TaxID=539206 RepID=UPI00210D8DC8|nr:DUF5017 domain-containing protein [Pedobacter xinjiangensis]